MNSGVKRKTGYDILVMVIMVILAILFIFPVYWIVTGSFKDAAAINAANPEWFPKNPTVDNYVRLFDKPALRWLFNSVFIAVMAMALTCITAAMAGYALAKKRFVGRATLFSFLVCAMALPKQVVLIPLLKEMSFLGLHDNMWAVMLEAVRIDGAGEVQTFTTIVLPIVKPGIGALAIFTFISTWNDYFLQLIMLNSSNTLTISLGIAKLQAEMSNDFGLIMAGAALGAIPIIAIFLMFQKYFTQGITMGAVKG